MTTRSVDRKVTPARSQAPFLVGLGMVMTGIFVMVGNTTGPVRVMGLVFLLGLGLMLLLWGILGQSSGPIIPGALLTGVSAGALLTQEVYGLRSLETAGVHALAIAASFVLITLLTGLFTGATLWWPLIPGSILLLGGLNLLLNDAVILSIGDFWSLALVTIGGYLILRFRRSI
ncbi:MAG: hypothetical protein K8J31_29185 [Anaerolineae bacterium]|nr:hypothetical protein [Anaerolineae bacterium]